ncbi:TPA: DUF3313 domain-containing protein [Serratia fonticola]|jgi:hypothetical protein|uniref:DUF3313 domain-containing protein n=1 Tax=Serratia fonticola TaxID=47917 RepID=UPI0021772EFD|nr:DUF3313 domain-containing protein [Serratia fonticola]CAI0772033.1 Protein of uncharacterised function (DUF3313) [Serratia fonticola]CAI0773153.1 Protein of uncharacterised function (DUF3313) [Serratia fonticola]CAI1090294.1 Protein of uncharacterised function (DUF3313) [Serratia fonticola]CAI1522661.1 Protein of uncharacterised function (DUF3313) [Serratia fonticola]CAI1532575.1 Protein of uncharacterised function (DUF3313) [Serratia fonticola]
MKKNRFGVAAAVLAAGILLAGCSSKVAETTQYSGFLQDYSKLQKTTTPSGHEVLRWIAPDFNVSDYRGVYVQPVAFYPPAKPNARVSQATLDQVREYANSRLKAAIAERATVLPNASGKRVLVANVAVTAIVAENEDLQFYEVVPVAAVIATTMAASGHRTQNAALFLEAKLVDQDTGKTVLAVVRKGYGKTVGNSTAPITFADVKKGIDDMIDDIVNFPK